MTIAEDELSKLAYKFSYRGDRYNYYLAAGFKFGYLANPNVFTKEEVQVLLDKVFKAGQNFGENMRNPTPEEMFPEIYK